MIRFDCFTIRMLTLLWGRWKHQVVLRLSFACNIAAALPSRTRTFEDYASELSLLGSFENFRHRYEVHTSYQSDWTREKETETLRQKSEEISSPLHGDILGMDVSPKKFNPKRSLQYYTFKGSTPRVEIYFTETSFDLCQNRERSP